MALTKSQWTYYQPTVFFLAISCERLSEFKAIFCPRRNNFFSPHVNCDNRNKKSDIGWFCATWCHTRGFDDSSRHRLRFFLSLFGLKIKFFFGESVQSSIERRQPFRCSYLIWIVTCRYNMRPLLCFSMFCKLIDSKCVRF